MTASPAADLMAAILDRPDDDGPRLIYADWLDENGEPKQANFIRQQIRAVTDPDYHGFLCLPEGPCQNCRTELRLFSSVANALELTTMTDVYCFAHSPKRSSGNPALTFRRGFVDSITCTMRQFMGGECEMCDGHGRHRVRLFDGTEEGYEQEDICPDCHGSGRIPGLASVVGSRWPVTSVTLSDREPYSALNGQYFWIDDHFDIPDCVPSSLWKYLRTNHGDAKKPFYRATFFPTRPAALTALSHACVDYMRELCGLRSLCRV